MYLLLHLALYLPAS